MIEVIVRLHDANASPRRPSQELGALRIINDGTGDSDWGNYLCTWIGGSPSHRDFRIEGHPRDLGVCELLQRVFDQIANE